MNEANNALIEKLQNEIQALDAISAKVKEMQDFISKQKGKLELTMKVTATNHSEMQAKREAKSKKKRAKRGSRVTTRRNKTSIDKL